MNRRIKLFNIALILMLIISTTTPSYALNKTNNKEQMFDNVIEVVEVSKEESIEHIKKELEKPKELTIEEMISERCKYYGIEDTIPLAIAKLETGHFTSNAYVNYNNPGGMSINEVPIKYDTIEEGVDAFIENLAINYFAIGLTTPETIGKKYCPVNAENWSKVVTQLME